MEKKIKITMLGTTSAGKTCYMLAMYAKMTEGVDGFTLTTTDPDMDIELIDMWEKLESGDDEQRWPKPNPAGAVLYEFDFSYGFHTKLMKFDWLDYRGGALRDKSSEQDVQDLQKNLSDSSCVFLCISGEFLSEKYEDASIIRKARIDRMNRFITGIGKNIPVVILITKSDLCKKRPKDELIEDIKKLFSTFFDKGAGWFVMICPVTLGDELAKDNKGGMIAPKHVHLPLIFAIYSTYLQELINTKREIEDAEKDLYRIKNRPVTQKFVDWWKGRTPEMSPSKKIDQHTQKYNEIAVKMSLMTQKLQHQDVSIYFDGKEEKVNE